MNLLGRSRIPGIVFVVALLIQGIPHAAFAAVGATADAAPPAGQTTDHGSSQPAGSDSGVVDAQPEKTKEKQPKEEKKGEPTDGGVTIMAQSLFHVGITSAGPAGDGYWWVTDGGLVTAMREAADDPLPPWYGDMSQFALNAPMVGIAGHPNGGGYWLAGRDGAVFAYGSAGFFGRPSVNNIVGISATPSGAGYWLVGSDGGIFAYGNAPFQGSLGGQGYTDVVGMAPTPSGQGYWLVRADGAIYSFGDAVYRGGSPGVPNIVGMAATKDGGGYWLLGSLGSVYSYGNADWYGNGSACCGFPFSGMVAKRGLHRGYRLINKNSTDFFYNGEDNQAPIGNVDENSYLRVRGWAVDPNTTTRSIDVQIKVDGVERYRQATPLFRGDVNAAYSGISGTHGFDWTVPTWLQDAQPHTVDVWALDSGGGSPTLLNRTTWTSPNSIPVGALEEVSGTRVKGWVYDPNTSAPVTVRIYVSDAAGVFPAAATASVTANLARGNPPTNNGFDWTVPVTFRDGKEHRVKVRALDYPTNEETPIGDPIVSFTRLDDDWAGTAPSWDTNKWVTTATNSTRLVDVLNNEGRLQVISSSARATANMAPVGDSDVTFTYRFESNIVRSYLRPMLRASGATGSNQMQTGYRVELRSDSNTIKLQSYVSGTSAPLGQFTYNPDGQPGPDPGNHRLRFQVIGSTIRVKLWPTGSSEPAGWQIDVPSDTTVTGTGVFQINHNYSAGTNTVLVDDLALSVPVAQRFISCEVETIGTQLVGDGRTAESAIGAVTCSEPVHADWAMGFNVRTAGASQFVACQDSEPSAAAGYYSTNPMPRRTCSTRMGTGRNTTTHYLRVTAARDGNQATIVNKDPSFYIDCPEGNGPCTLTQA